MESVTATPVATPEEPVASGPAVLQPLRKRDFRLVFLGESISLIGDQFHFVALAWLTLQLTGSGFALGTVLTVAAIPRAIFMLLGGALSDRFSPRTLMLTSNALRGVVVGVMAAVVISGNAQLWQLYVLAVIFGVVDAFFYPALNTIVPMLVSDRQLPPANALVQIMQQMSGLIGPAIAGLVVAAVQTGPAFAVDAASFGVATVAISLVRGGRRAAKAEGKEAAAGESLLGTIGSGLGFAWRDPAVRSLILLIAAFNFAFAGPISVGLPYLADNRFDGGPALFGLMFSCFGAGAVVGAAFAGSLKHVPQLGWMTLIIAGALGVGMAAIGWAPHVMLALIPMVGIGIGAGFLNVRVIAWLQQRTPEAMRGRVMSLVMLGAVGLQPISLAVSGAIIDLGADALLFMVAGGIVLTAVVSGAAAGIPARMHDEVAA
ncbi:MAG TPA: MFS transporter [Candidatus Limnocylindria bacterium]|jgi:MFS family permease